MGPRERHMRTTKTHLVPAIVGSFIGFLLIAGIAFGIGMLGNVSRWLQDLPDYTNTDLYLTSEPTTVLDAQGNQIASFYAQNRKSITIDQVSPYVLDGTVATEDERFYEHNGVDLMGIMRRRGGAAHRRPRGRLDHHPAARTQHHPLRRAV